MKKTLYPILVVGMFLFIGFGILYLPGIITKTKKKTIGYKKTGSGIAGFPLTVVDSIGREILVKERPNQIISLAPSLTQAIFVIGAEGRLVGRTRYCLWPPEAKTIKSIGGPAVPEIESMMALNPDLVLATTLTPIEVVQHIEALGMPIAIFKQEGVEGTFSDMQVIGRLTGFAYQADKAIQELEKRKRDLIEKIDMIHQRPRTLLLYGLDGLYSAKVGTFPSDMIGLSGGDNVVKATVSDWPQLSMESIIEWNPEVILVTLPFGGKEKMLVDKVMDDWKKDARWSTISAVMKHRIYFLDDTLMSVPGPLMIETAEKIAKALHPEIFSQSPL